MFAKEIVTCVLPLICFFFLSAFCLTRKQAYAKEGKVEKNFVLAYYIPFLTETYGGVTRKSIKEKNGSDHLNLFESDLKRIYRFVSKEKEDCQINDDRIRLLVGKSMERQEITIDQTGCVMEGKAQYRLSPYNFLSLSSILEYFADRQAKASKHPREYTLTN